MLGELAAITEYVEAPYGRCASALRRDDTIVCTLAHAPAACFRSVEPHTSDELQALLERIDYKLVAVADGYFRAFQTNGTPDYHRAELLPDTRRFENGAQFTGNYRNDVYAVAADGFHRGRFIGRNLWDRRYAVVDEERGIVLTILRFGRLDGPIENASSVTAFDRLVAEFFTVKSGKIQEVQAILFNLDDAEPTGWDTHWYGPRPGGWHNMPTGQ